MTAPYVRGDRVRYRSVEYTVEACYESENGGYELRARDDEGGTVWVDADEVEAVVVPVVDSEQQGLGL